MEESKTPSDEDETDETNEDAYYLCPICSTDETPCGEISVKKLAGHVNRIHTNKKTGDGEKWEDYKDQVQTTDVKPQNLIQREKKKSESKPKAVVKKGGKMSEDEDSEVIAELGEAAALKGRIRKLLKGWATLDESDRDSLMSERERLVEFMHILSSRKNMPEDIVRDIEGKIDTDIDPVIRTYTNPDDNTPSEEKGNDKPMTDVQMKGRQLRSKIKQDLESIANLPSKHQDQGHG